MERPKPKEELIVDLTRADLELILQSLGYTKQAYENTAYPTYQLRREQLDKVEALIDKIRALRDKASK